MLCSVIVSTINRDTFPRAINSVLTQDFEDFEVIVVNDSGNPMDVAPYADLKNVRFVETHKAGLCFACNTGIAIAQGEFIKILHDDDYLLPGALKALVTAAQETHTEWVLGSARIVDEDGNTLYDLDSSTANPNLLGDLFGGDSPHMSYCLFQRKACLEVGGFDALMETYEDRDLCWRFAVRQNVVGIQHSVACIRVSASPGSAYHQAVAERNVFRRANRRVREKILDHPRTRSRIAASLRTDVFLRGRVCRQSASSAVLNLWPRPLTALSRLLWTLRMMNWHFIRPGFWRGLLKGIPKLRPFVLDAPSRLVPRRRN